MTPTILAPARSLLAGVLFCALAAAGCTKTTERPRYAPGAAARVLKVDMAALRPAIAQRIEKSDRPAWVTPERWKRVRALYQRFGDAPLWLEEGGVKDRAGAVLAAIKAAPEHALDTASYPISALASVVVAERLTDTASAGTLADADVLLTAAYVAYATDMLAGQVDPKTVSQAWHIPAMPHELDSALVRGIQEVDLSASLAALPPQDPDYASLKDAYARYKKLAQGGGWPTLTATATPDAIRARLAAESFTATSAPVTGDTAAAPPSPPTTSKRAATPVDASLRPLVALYQERHGLARTGTLDKATLEALNVPAQDREVQIAANLERHRWLPRSLGTRYVYVNVPAFRFTAYDSGRKTLEMKVVVGEEFQGKVTPVFSDSMESVVFRPYWNITPDIQSGEIAGKIRANPGYLERNNMEYYKDGSVTRIRQRPGEKNSLGLVKFLFPNNFNIYLHDTPAKELFQQADRAASHGCIRLEKPAELAQWVLGWDAARVQTAMNSGTDNSAVKVPQKIPVYIVYFTAYFRDGQLYFADDLYGRDETLASEVAA